jgi:hypothetical protein
MKGVMSDIDLDELRTELDGFAQPEKKCGRSLREQRIIAGFEEIQCFVERRSTGKIATSSNGSTRCASTAFVRLTNVDRCLGRSTIRGF